MSYISKNYSLCVQKLHETEKTFNLGTNKTRVVSMKCPKSMNKNLIKFIFKKYLDIKVIKVNIVKVKGKFKRFKNSPGKMSDWKKLYVTIDRKVEFESDMLLKLASEF